MVNVLTAVLQSMGDSILAFSNLVSSTYMTLVASLEADEEIGGFMQPEGWYVHPEITL